MLGTSYRTLALPLRWMLLPIFVAVACGGNASGVEMAVGEPSLTTPIPEQGLREVPADYRGELVAPYDEIDDLNINPDGSLWVVSEDVYTAPFSHTTWTRIDNLTLENAAKRIEWIDANHGFVVSDNECTVTADRGTTWTPCDGLTLGKPLVTTSMPNGRAWIAGGDGKILYSGDFGASWDRLAEPIWVNAIVYRADRSSESMKVFPDLKSIAMKDDFGFVSTGRSGYMAITQNNWNDYELVTDVSESGDVTSIEICHNHFYRLNNESGLYQSPLGQNQWTKIENVMPSLLACDQATNQLFALLKDNRLVEIQANGRVTDLARIVDDESFSRLQANRGRLVWLNWDHAVYRYESGVVDRHFPLVQGKNLSRPAQIHYMDHTAIMNTRRHLYQAKPGDDRWSRRIDLDGVYPESLVVSSSVVLLWDTRGGHVRYDGRLHELNTMASLENYRVRNIIRRGCLLYTYGVSSIKHGDDEVLHVHGFWPTRQGFIAKSEDLGMTWEVLFEWETSDVRKIHPRNDQEIYLLSSLGAIGKISASESGWNFEGVHAASEDDSVISPSVQSPIAFNIRENGEGYVYGDTHYLGDLLYTTDDYGRSWTFHPKSSGQIDPLLILELTLEDPAANPDELYDFEAAEATWQRILGGTAYSRIRYLEQWVDYQWLDQGGRFRFDDSAPILEDWHWSSITDTGELLLTKPKRPAGAVAERINLETGEITAMDLPSNLIN